MTTTMQPRLPPELTDAILDYLVDERTTLAACALASRIFLPRARIHIFDNITLSHPRLGHSPAYFLTFLEHNPWAAQLVHTLSVQAESGFKTTQDGPWNGDCSLINERIQALLWKTANDRQWTCNDAALPVIIASLPRLDAFNAGALRWRLPPRAPDGWESALMQTSALKTLHLDFVEFTSIPTLIEVLRSFPGLRALTLGVVLTATFPWLELPEGPLLSLETLDVDMEGSGHVADTFVSHPDTILDWKSVKRLRIRKCFRSQIEVVRKMIDLAENLEELDVGEVVIPPEYETRYPPLSVGCLKSLTFTLSSPTCVRWWERVFSGDQMKGATVHARVASARLEGILTSTSPSMQRALSCRV